MNDYEHIADLIEQGRKIEAIKLLREATGASLAEAKEQVERLTAEAAGQPDPAEQHGLDTNGLPEDVLALARAGQKIEAIKLLRERNGIGLKEAKEQVDAAIPPDGSASRKIIFAVLAALLVALLGVVLPLLL